MSQFLDEEDDIDLDRLVVEDEPPPARRSINLRPVLVGVMVLLLGGGLGTAAYFLHGLDVGDVIGMLDVADQGPVLSMGMPDRGDGPQAVEPPAAAPAAQKAHTPAAKAADEAPKAEAAPAPPVPAPAPAAPPPVIISQTPAEPGGLAVPKAPLARDAKQVPGFTGLPEIQPGKPLADAPDPMLVRDGSEGPLPIVALDGRVSWKEYGHPFAPPASKPMVAVVVAGLGLAKDPTEAAIARLPAEITLAFSPYAAGLDRSVKAARKAGHEIMVALPTEPSGYPASDPGPWGLLTSLEAEDNVARLEKVLSRAVGYVGVLAADGPFVRSPAHLAPVLGVLKERGLMYVGPGAEGENIPVHVGIAEHADADPFREAIDARLARAAITARETGRAVVVLSPSPVAMERLAAWLGKLKDQGVVLAPVSALVRETGKS